MAYASVFWELTWLSALELSVIFSGRLHFLKLHCLLSGLDGSYFQGAVVALFSKGDMLFCFSAKRKISTNMSVLSRNTWIDISPSVAGARLLGARLVTGPWQGRIYFVDRCKRRESHIKGHICSCCVKNSAFWDTVLCLRSCPSTWCQD